MTLSLRIFFAKKRKGFVCFFHNHNGVWAVAILRHCEHANCNMSNKKDVIWPGLRMPSEMAQRLRDALDKLGVDGPNFRRKLAEDIIDIAESGDQVELPPRVLRIKNNKSLKH